MTNLIQLPPEVLLQIATSCRSRMPARTRLDRPTPSDKVLRDDIRAETIPILYLSLTCKRLAQLLAPELARFVAINSGPRVYSFLRLLWARPGIADHVQQLYLHSPPADNDVPSFGHEQMQFLQSWAKSMNIDVDDAVLECPDGWHEAGFGGWLPVVRHDETCLAAATAMLLHRLNQLREVTLSLSNKTLADIPGFLGYGLGGVCQRAEHAQQPGDILPNLKSVALKLKLSFGVGSGVWFSNSMLLCLASLSTSLTEIQVVDGHFYDLNNDVYGLGATFLNLNNLILRNVSITSKCLGEFLSSFPNLSSFTLQSSIISHPLGLARVETPRGVVHGLKRHYEGLRKLCLELDPMADEACPNDECITTLKDFVNLEDLQIDAWSIDHDADDIDDSGSDNGNEFGGDDGQQTAKVPALRALPASLKRLCIKGADSGTIEQSINWLMMNLKDSLPNLEELEISGAISVTSQASAAMEKLGIKFRYCWVDTVDTGW